MGNTFGKIFKLTTFGESHGKAIGGIINGCSAGLELDFENIQKQLDRRKPGQSKITTQRKESDTVEFLSGIFEGITTGTACRVVSGAIAQQILDKVGVKITAYVSAVGNVKLNKCHKNLDLSLIDTNLVRCPDVTIAEQMITTIEKTKKEGDTLGGEITVLASSVPTGWGEPVFDKLHADIGKGMLSINAVHGFKYGFGGVDISSGKGSEVNDSIIDESGKTKTNYSGGIQGGISNGNDIYCEVAFKPVATIMQKQNTIDKAGNKIEIKGKGRHDACVVPRAVPVVESMMALTLVDAYLRSKTNRI